MNEGARRAAPPRADESRGGRGRAPRERDEDRGDRVRMEVVFRGRVQGVFFRATTRDVAADHEVDGWVANQPDGSVRLEAEGRRAELERFLAAIEEARKANIESVDVQWRPATGEFEDFSIRR